MTDVVTLLMVNAAALLAAIVVLWAYSVRIGDVSFIDAFWALCGERRGFFVVAENQLAVISPAGSRHSH